ncbi:tetraspanin-9-like [Ostrea edulis]|uniref:tetraspanin-9-like n=1 Tax=Ostrea edulis TaxID=37623 RepID=UPI0024AEA3DC|nr:tetraspanin-9-like [Ostrea edulis]
MAMDCCGRFGKVFLISINIIFLLLGIGLSITGILARINALPNEILPALDTVQVAGNNMADLFKNISILVAILGACVTLVAGLGLFGACCEVKCLLITYAILVLIFLVMKIAAIVVWFQLKDELNPSTKDKLLEVLQKNFIDDSLNSTSKISNAWNLVFLMLDCCGVNPVEGSTNDFDLTPWCTTNGTCHRTNAQIPRSCCNGVDETNFTKASRSCFFNVSNYHTQGCFERLQELIKTYSTPAIGILFTVVIIMLLAVVCAFVLCNQTGSKSNVV